MPDLFDSDTPVSDSMFDAYQDDVEKAVEVLRNKADSMEPSMERETLEAAAKILEVEEMQK